MPDTVMIVTGETSGELYGALLAEALKRKAPGIRIIGIGGERMLASGVELISGISSTFGIAEAVSSFRKIKETFNKASAALVRERPAVVVLIDYPDFNLRLAGLAKRVGIRILYYVSPQVWAWRKNRVKKIARLVDKMAVVLPFEEEIYKAAGLQCEFVGHPVFDEIREKRVEDRDKTKEELGLKRETPVLSLLPGSRPNELQRLMPVMLGVVKGFKREFGGFQFCMPLAPNTEKERYRDIIEGLQHEGAVINKGESLRALAVSDLAVIASGTATLQAALLGVPFVVVYKLSPLTYLLGKMFVKVKHISLVNILTGAETAKELLQEDATSEKIIRELRRIIREDTYRCKMSESFEKIRRMFSEKKASERVAEIVAQTAGWD